jgi:MFS family permease
MLREYFGGHNPTHFHVSPLVRAYIISESFLWSGWNLVTPIAALFVVNNIAGGNVQIAATGYSLYLIFRVVFELITGEFLAHSDDRRKMLTSLIGISLITVSYLGFSISHDILHLFLFYAISGAALGIASPAKNTLFAIHLDKDKEATEYGVADAISFVCMALATALGGFVANEYGFSLLFLLAAFMNTLSLIPYFLILRLPKGK